MDTAPRARRSRRIAWSIVCIGLAAGVFLYVTGLLDSTLGNGESLRPEPYVAAIENGVQQVRTEQRADGYVPNDIVVKKGVPVRWTVDSKSPYTCSAYLVAPKLGVKKFLDLGENVFEFTPEEAGEILLTQRALMWPLHSTCLRPHASTRWH